LQFIVLFLSFAGASYGCGARLAECCEQRDRPPVFRSIGLLEIKLLKIKLLKIEGLKNDGREAMDKGASK
jgi:hypothetical protein